MAKLFGNTYTRRELERRIGDISQVGGVRRMRLSEGMQDGVDTVLFQTGSGLEFLCVPGRGLDITYASFKGVPFAWMSPAKEVSHSLYDPHGIGWLRSFAGGLVTTCGMSTVGAPSVDEGEELGVHGRFSNTPADNVWVDGEWDGDEYKMWAAGKVKESRIFAENLVCRRTVSAVLGENRFYLNDEVTNEGPRTVPHMFLYHINGGYPAIDEGSALVSPSKSAAPRDADAEVDKENYWRNDGPTDGYKERCYYHDMATDNDNYVYSALINKNNRELGAFGFYVKYKLDQLPRFTQWKMNGTREYVVGMEPANCWVEGRVKERERGMLQFLEPGETRRYDLEIGVISGDDEASVFEKKVADILAASR